MDMDQLMNPVTGSIPIGDTMVLGEILFRATGQDLQTYADTHLFQVAMSTQWRDNTPSAQVDGNYLAHCCLDATPRDFAKFGQLLLNNGMWMASKLFLPPTLRDKKYCCGLKGR